MSININSNKIVKFGKNLPTVYIDKISVELTQITVNASCYFAKPADVSDASFQIFYEDVLKSVSFTSILLPENAADSDFTVSGGTVTSMPIYDYERIHFSSDDDVLLLGKYFNGIFQDDDGDYGLNIEQALKREPTNIWHLIRALRGYGTMDSTGTVRGTTVKKGPGAGKKVVFPIPDGAEIEGEDEHTTYPAFLGMFFENAYNTLEGTDTIYDDAGNEVIRCRLRKTFSIANKDFGEYNESRSRTDGPMLYLEAMFGGVEFTLACFTTTLEFDAHRDEFDFLDITRPGKATATEGYGYTRADLYTKQISDVTFETVSTGGMLASIARPVYKLIDTDTVYTEGDVLQAIDSLYYADDGMKRSDILDVFKGLVRESEATINAASNSSPTASDAAAGYPGVDTSELATLQEAIDNLKVILQANGHKVDFLPKLRLYEKTFAETSTVTPVGDFYERFQSTLLNVNSAVKTGTQLVKSVNLNTVVVDLTATTVDGYSSYFDTSAITSRTPDANGAYVKAAIGYSTTAAAYAGEDRDGEPMVSAPYTGPAFYCTYTDPNRFELYPSNNSLTELLHRYGLGTELFYELNFDRTYSGDSDYSSSPSNVAFLATACEQIVAYDFLQVTGFRFGSAHGWSETPFPSGVWMDMKVEDARQLLSCLAHNFIRSTSDTAAGEAAGALEPANDLLHDLIAMAMTTELSDFGQRDAEGAAQKAFAPGKDLYGAGDFFTNVYVSDWGSAFTADSGKVNVRFRNETGITGGAGYGGMLEFSSSETTGEIGTPYDAILNSWINILGGYTDTNFGLLYNHMASLFSSKASMLLSAQVDFLRSTGVAISESKLDAIDRMLLAVRNPTSNICALYAFALCYEFTKTMQEKGSQYQITDLNGYMFGYWWFDYEHAFTKKSLISYIYHISNVEAYFGKPVTSETFKVTEATVRRYHQKRNSDRKLSKDFDPSPGRKGVIPNADNLQLAGRLTARFDSDGERVVFNDLVAPPYPPASAADFSDSVLDYDSMGGSFSNSFTPSILEVEQVDVNYFGMDYGIGADISRKSGPQYTYLINRAFQLPSNDMRPVGAESKMVFRGDEAEAFWGNAEWDIEYRPPGSYELGLNYRLMCFEHQEVAGPITEGAHVTEFEFPYSFLQHEVKVTDTTGKIVAALVDAFMNCYNNDFKNFIEQAMEDCNYNEYDGKFNDYYIEKVMSELGEDASEAPWVKMCVLYHLHRDLVYNTYGGDKTILMDAVLRQLEKISPTSGTLDQIIAFDNAVRDFIDVVYIGDSSVESSICRRLVIAGFEPYTRINGTSAEGGLEHRTINLLFQNGGSTTAREEDAVSPEFCEMYSYIPEPLNLINTISDGQSPPTNLYEYGIRPIADFIRYLVSYYCVEGHIQAYTTAMGVMMSGEYMFEPYRDFYDYDTIDMYTMPTFLESDIDVASYVLYEHTPPSDHSPYSAVLGPTIAIHLIDKLIEIIRIMDTTPEYAAIIKDSERIDYVHKHALMTINERSTVEDITSRVDAAAGSYEGLTATYILLIKQRFRDAFEDLIKHEMLAGTTSTPGGRGLVFKVQYANRAGQYDPDSRYMTSRATLDEEYRVYDKQWLNQYYLDHGTLCDNLVGVFLGAVCIMAKRTENFIANGENPTTGTGAGITGLLNLKVNGNTVREHVKELIASQADQYAVDAREDSVDHLPYSFGDFWRPQKLQIFQGVYEFADGQSTLQQGYDVIDEFERAEDTTGVYATT